LFEREVVMLKSMNDILGYKLSAADGDLGSVKDFFFDDNDWVIRYFVVNTRRWLPGRLVLISPSEVKKPDWDKQVLPVSLTMDQVKNSPEIQSDLPVSRQNEIELMNYYGWNHYWGPIGEPGSGRGLGEESDVRSEAESEVADWDPHLRSTGEVTGYNIQSIDEPIGQMKDLIVETSDWNVRYIVIDTQKWLPGKKVLISSAWINRVDGVDKKVYVDLSSNAIKDSPEFEPGNQIDFEYEARLYDYYIQAG
jgi:hypothetical protein